MQRFQSIARTLLIFTALMAFVNFLLAAVPLRAAPQPMNAPLVRAAPKVAMMTQRPPHVSSVGAATAVAITITVDTMVDDSSKSTCQENVPADCSLRGAIQQANQNSAALFTIQVPAGQYTLTAAGSEEDSNLTGDLDITTTQTLVIAGDLSGGTTVQGDLSLADNGDRLFDIEQGSQVTLARLVMQNGYADVGGAIYNRGELTITQSTVRNNTAGAAGGLNNDGDATIIQSTLRDNLANDYGGALSNAGQLTVTNSTIISNVANSSGGIDNVGMLMIDNSALINNHAVEYGGALSNQSGQVTLVNSTVSGNQVTGEDPESDGGGAIDQYGASATLHATYSTLAYNTAAIPDRSGLWIEDGTVTLHNTILANNNGSNSSAHNLLLAAGAVFTSLGHNLSDNWQGASLQPTDLTAAPALAPLAEIGIADGYPALGHELLPDSAALDQGENAACPATDQRGLLRPQGVACDIGAVEKSVSQPSADLTLQATAVPEVVVVNNLITYTLTVKNNGPDRADNLLLTTTLPLSVTLLEASASCQPSARTVVCSGGTLASNSTYVVRLTVQASAPGPITTSVQVASSVADPNLADNQALVQTLIVKRPDVINPPDTVIKTQPLSVTESSMVTLLFNGIDGGAGVAGFECALDSSAFTACTSPHTYTDLAAGQHTFQVRAYDTLGTRDATPALASWTIVEPTPEGTVKPDQGGVVVTADQSIMMTFPPGAVDSAINVTVTLISTPTHTTGALRFAGKAFTVIARDLQDRPVTTFTKPYTLILTYQEKDWQNAGITQENALTLYFWNGNGWQALLPCNGCGLDTTANRITVLLDHLTEFALLGPQPLSTRTLYLPLVHR